MAKNAYIGVDGKARKVKNIYIGVDGKARKVKKAYIGVGGKARLFYSAWNGGLFPDGEELTGGWEASKYPYKSWVDWDGYGYGMSALPTLTTNDSTMSMSIKGNYSSGTVHTVNMIDLTDYNTITVNMSTSGATDGEISHSQLYLTQDLSSSFNFNNATYKTAFVNGEISLDVSDVTGSWYVCFGVYTTAQWDGSDWAEHTSTYNVTSVMLS